MFISQFFLFSFVLRKCQLRSYLSQQEGTVSVNTAPQLLCKQSTRGWGGLLEVGKERIYKRVSGLSSDVLVSDLWSHQIELDFWAAICVGTGWPNWPIDKLWWETSSSASLSPILNFWILDIFGFWIGQLTSFDEKHHLWHRWVLFWIFGFWINQLTSFHEKHYHRHRWVPFWIFANYKLGNQIKQWKHCSGNGFEPDIPKQPHPLM